MITYGIIKQLLLNAVNDVDFVRKNTILQDPVLKEEFITRVEALSNDVVVPLGHDQATTAQGALSISSSRRSLLFEPSKAGFAISSFREGTISSPGKISARVKPGCKTPTDGTRYFLADADKGLLLLDKDLNLKTVFPGLDQVAVGLESYNTPSHAITFTEGGVEYLAVAMASHHIVRVWNMRTKAFVRTIGSPDLPGVPSTNLDSPVALTWAGGKLWIACQSGQPAGASASNGYIAVHDWATDITTVFSDLVYKTTGSLLLGEVIAPRDIFFDGGVLWILNGNDEVASFPLDGGHTTQFVSTKTSEYSLSNVTSLVVKTDSQGRLLYLANSNYGNIVVIDTVTGKLHSLLGHRCVEDNATSQQSIFFGNSGSVDGVLPDTVDGTHVVITSDQTNQRLQRLDEDAYKSTNWVEFAMQGFTVPVSIKGWCLSGDIPLDMITLEYRLSVNDPWAVLGRHECIGPLQSIQCRVLSKLMPFRAAQTWEIKEITLLATQA